MAAAVPQNKPVELSINIAPSAEKQAQDEAERKALFKAEQEKKAFAAKAAKEANKAMKIGGIRQSQRREYQKPVRKQYEAPAVTLKSFVARVFDKENPIVLESLTEEQHESFCRLLMSLAKYEFSNIGGRDKGKGGDNKPVGNMSAYECAIAILCRSNGQYHGFTSDDLHVLLGVIHLWKTYATSNVGCVLGWNLPDGKFSIPSDIGKDGESTRKVMGLDGKEYKVDTDELRLHNTPIEKLREIFLFRLNGQYQKFWRSYVKPSKCDPKRAQEFLKADDVAVRTQFLDIFKTAFSIDGSEEQDDFSTLILRLQSCDFMEELSDGDQESVKVGFINKDRLRETIKRAHQTFEEVFGADEQEDEPGMAEKDEPEEKKEDVVEQDEADDADHPAEAIDAVKPQPEQQPGWPADAAKKPAEAAQEQPPAAPASIEIEAQ